MNYYDKTVSLSESDLRNTWFYYDSRDVPKNMDYALDGLTFEANRRADSGTLRLKFEIYDADGRIMCTAPWILKSAAVPVPPRGTSPIR